MQLPTFGFASLMEQMAASVQGTATALIDFTVGSVMRAILEANAAVALWLQWLILQVLSATRASTSQGPDLDSWMADFSFTRLGGTPAQGIVTFGRYTPGLATTINAGASVATADGSQTFTVVAQPANPTWNGVGGYTLAAALSSIDLPVEAVAAGTGGNVVATSITLLTTPLSGVDWIVNATALTGGMNAESDAAFRARFQLYINSRSLSTVTAIEAAVASLQQGLRYTVFENQAANGTSVIGSFCVIADDGTGYPSESLLAEVLTAVGAVRPIGSTYYVLAPSIAAVSVTMSLLTTNAATHAAVAASVQFAVATWIGGLPIGGRLALSMLEAIAHETDPRVISVTTALINGAAADFVAPSNGVIIAASVTVS